MNDNIDDWLNTLFDEAPPVDSQTSIPAVHITAPETDSDIVAVQNPVDTVEPQSLTEQDFSDVLEEYGFNHSEEVEAEEVEEEEDSAEEEEVNTSFNVAAAIDDDPEWNGYHANTSEGRTIDRQIHDFYDTLESRLTIPAFHFVGDGELLNAGDVRLDPTTGATQALLESGAIVEIGNTARENDIATPFDSFDYQMEIVSADRRNVPNPDISEVEETSDQLLPQNSPTLLLDESTTRFSGAEWYNIIQRQNVIVAGIGGIGSNVAFQLSRMHPAGIFMYDNDSVETVNMAGQLYAREDVGKSKVSAMSDMICKYTNMQNVYAIQEEFTENTEAGNIMICGFDNMSARRTFFDAWYKHLQDVMPEDRKKCLFLDGRLSLDTLQVFCLTGDDVYNIGRYNKDYLFSDSDADETVCSMKQTTYLACMIGSIMVNLFTNFTANLLDPVIPYDLPFFTEYDAQNMIFKTVN